MKVVAVFVGVIGLIVLASSFWLGLLVLAMAAGLWMLDPSRQTRTVSPRPIQPSQSTAPRPTSPSPSARSARMQWLGPGREVMVHGYLVADALIYYSPGPPSVREASCIDLSLPVARPVLEPKGALGYWPQYAEISPGQRANYLQWLVGGRKDTLQDIGYVFIYFYGLERRALIENQDHELVLEEVLRLLGQYRQSASFDGYLGSFVEYVTARRGLERIDENWFRRLLARSPTPLALAWLHRQQRPLPADLALQVAKQDVRAPRSVVVDRVADQFQELFRHKYEDRFGSGLQLKAAARDTRLEYRPGSPTLLHQSYGQTSKALSPVTIPNVYGIQSQFKPLVQIWTECIEELRPLSRQVAKGGESASREVYWSLPPELRAETDHPDRPRWEQVVAAQTPRGPFALVPVSSLAQLQGVEERPKLTRKQSEELAATACAVGFGIAPDRRVFGRAYRWDETVALFRMEHPGPPQDAGYLSAACMTELGVALAAADGTVDAEEIRHITGFLENQFAFAAGDALHLDGYREVLLQHPPRMSSLGRQLQEKLAADQREMIGRFLVGVAAANGAIERKEITALKGAYRSLGIGAAKVDDLLAEVRGPGEPIDVQTAEPAPAGEPIPARAAQGREPAVVLDMTRVHQLFAGTAEVQRLLASAMLSAEDDEEVAPVPSAGHPASAVPISVAPTVPLGLLDGLDARYHPIVTELLARDEWGPQEIGSLARKYGLMPSGMIEVINTWADEHLGDFLLLDEGAVRVQRALLEQVQ